MSEPDLSGLHPVVAFQVALQHHMDARLSIAERTKNLLRRLSCWWHTAYLTLRANGLLWWRDHWHDGHLYVECESPHPNFNVGRCDCGHYSVCWVLGPWESYKPMEGEPRPDGADPRPASHAEAIPMTEMEICNVALDCINNLDALVQP